MTHIQTLELYHYYLKYATSADINILHKVYVGAGDIILNSTPRYFVYPIQRELKKRLKYITQLLQTKTWQDIYIPLYSGADFWEILILNKWK